MGAAFVDRHWADGVREAVLSLSAGSDAPFLVEGGAAEAAFPLVGRLQRPQTHTYLRGEERLQEGQLVLEVVDRAVAGLTKSAVAALLAERASTGGPLRIKTVKEGYLSASLREYLTMRFPKDSLDYDLQSTIRDNVYTKTVPCTTREQRPGEKNGVDYNFVSAAEFAELERSGDLLESGIYEGNWYGTPKPAEGSTSEVSSSTDSSRRPPVEMPALLPPSASDHSHLALNGHSNGMDTPLPANWEAAYTEYGEMYFIDHNTGTTQWQDPRASSQRPSVSGSQASTAEQPSTPPLPDGWEQFDDPQYGTFYVDHVNKRTQYERPSLASTSASMPSVQHAELFTRNPAELRGQFIDTRLVKGSRGLGFTLIGNDATSPADEFLQIKTIIPHGPADLDARLRMGDILVFINQECVLGYTQEDVIGIFQSIPVGAAVGLRVCRGYPLFFDADHQIVTQDVYGDARQSTLRATELLTVNIAKGDEGFGFTIADSAAGQRVKKILYASRCPGLMEGDVLCEINGVNVRNMSHADIVDVLRDCPIGQQAGIVVQRSGRAPPPPPLVNGHANGRPPVVPAKPRLNHSTGSAPRPHSFHQTVDARSPFDRRSKTPTADFGYGQRPMPTVRAAPSVKPRSRTPASLPPRPEKANGYLPTARASTQPRVPGSPFADGIYENLPGKMRERSASPHAAARTAPSRGGFAAATPNYVPASVYNERYRQSSTPTPLESTAAFDLLTINLIRRHDGFGFRVIGGTEEGTQIIVGQVVAGGAASQDGRLRCGDEIVEIDGVSVVGGRHQVAVDLMQRAALAGHVKLVVRRPLNELPRSASMPVRTAPQPFVQQYQQAAAVQQPRYTPVADPSTPFPYSVTVHRDESEGFGFVIMSSLNKNGSTIGRIIEQSPAARCGQLRVGDRIIAVNGVNILSKLHGDIVNLIKDSGYSVTLTVGDPNERPAAAAMPTSVSRSSAVPLERQESLGSMLEELDAVERFTRENDYLNVSVSDPPSPDRLVIHQPYQNYFGSYVPPSADRQGAEDAGDVTDDEQLFEVELQRGAKGFGFSIRGGQEFGAMPLFVLRIADGGPAARDGRLRVGDQLVEIAAQPTDGMSHERAINLIKRDASVRLLVRRRAADEQHALTAPLATDY